MSLLGGLIKDIGGAVAGAVGLGPTFENVYAKANPNIASDLSKQYGCTIMQSDAPLARQRVSQGLNPCTGAPIYGPTAPWTGTGVTQTGYRAAMGKIEKAYGPGTGPVITGKGGYTAMSMFPVSTGMSAVGAVAKLAPGIIRTTTGRISSIVLPTGRKFSAKKAASLIRRVGLEAAGAALGLGIVQVAEILLTTQPTRRRRGISYAQLRNARRVACTVSRMARDLQVKPAPARRRSTCR